MGAEKLKTQHGQMQTASTLPTYPSMAACTAATGIPRRILQQAKRGGCDAFDQANRVHLDKLLPFLFKPEGDDQEEAADWSDRLKRAQALIAEMKLEQTKRRLVDVELIERVHQRVGLRSRTLFSAIMEQELPPKLAGQSVERCRQELSRAADRVCSEMSKGLARWVVEAANDDGETEEADGLTET